MTSFLNQKLGQTFGHSVPSIGQPTNVELRVGNHTVIVKERLAEGGFGFVDLVSEIHSRKDFVLKRCNVDRETAFATVKKEISILQRFAGPNMVELIDTDIITKNRTSREALLLLAFCPGGHLLDRLNSRNGSPLPAESVYRIFGQLLMALKPMHENRPPVVHRDLKLENILFGQDGKVRLCDFGSCVEGHISIATSLERQNAEEIIQKETTQMYRAPEMVDLYMRNVLTEKTDIWALGCIMYALCFLKHPIQDAGPLGILSAKIVFPKNSTFSEETHAFIMKMLDVDPEARLSVMQCIECITALANNEPLPDHPLTEEAKTRRAERLAANELRQNKQKKVAVVAPKKVIGPLDSNSVAARRLAAKRGETTHGGGRSDVFVDHNVSHRFDTSSPELDNSFDPFSTQQAVASFAPVTSTSAATKKANKSSVVEFDAFGDSINGDFEDTTFNQPIKAAANHISSADSLFDDDEEVPAFTSTNPSFDAFQAPSNNTVHSSSFDAFEPSSADAVGTFDPFSSSVNVANNSNTFDGDFAPSTRVTHAPAVSTFDEFTASVPVASSSAATSSFNAFNDDSKDFVPVTDAFSPSVPSDVFTGTTDPFGGAPLAKPNKPAKNIGMRRSSFATVAAPPVDLLDVDDVSESSPRVSLTDGNGAVAGAGGGSSGLTDFDAFSSSGGSNDVLQVQPFAVVSSTSTKGLFTVQIQQAPPVAVNFMDDLLVPQPVVSQQQQQQTQYNQQQQHAWGQNDQQPSQQQEQRRSISRDPADVLSLFDQPPPPKPVKPVMLNNSNPVMIMGGGAMGGMGNMGGPPRGMVSPRGGMQMGPSPGGMQGVLSMQPPQPMFSPTGSSHGPGMGGFSTPNLMSPSVNAFQQSPASHAQQQQQFSSGPVRSIQNTPRGVIQTNRAVEPVDPFDSIKFNSMSGNPRR